MRTDSTAPFALRLLHLEDSVADAELIQNLLLAEWPGCQIERVDTLPEFLSALEQGRYDLILSDFSMPSFDGLTALKLARERSSATPFVFLSGTIGEDNAVEALQGGATDYVIKDRPARLVPAIRRALEQSRDQRLRRRAEQQLHEQAELLDKAREAICVTDIEGRITYSNRSARQLFGLTGDHGHGRHLNQLFGVLNQPLIPEALRQLHANGAWSGEMRLSGPDGSLRNIDNRWTLVRDDTNQPKSILLIITDITEQKKLEAQLLRSQRMEGIGTLASGIAHDLNNVLTPILMSVSLLQQETHNEETLRLLTVLETSAKHGADLIRQVLTFARGAEGERAELQLKFVIRDVVTLLGETLPRAIEIQTECAPDLWPVSANSTQISQVLMNLGVNARDAMPGGGQLTFQAGNTQVDEALAHAQPDLRPGPYVLIKVADTGCGIPAEVIDRIFDPFYTTKKIGKGTGLGLSTALGIVKAHNGCLLVQSTVEQGTEFLIYLPAVATARVAPAEQTPASRPSLPKGKGETILVIDDEKAVRDVSGALLKACGFTVLSAESGLAGLALYREHRAKIQAVLTDMMMPGIQGPEFIRELRVINPDVPIVAMSGMMGERFGLEEEAGRLVFLQKPMTVEELIRKLRLVLPC